MAVASAVVPFALAAAALAAGSGTYKGRTSQHQPVSFSISRGAVHSFKIVINDKCPDCHKLSVTARYPAMTISHGSFGGSFTPVGGHPGEHAKLTGTVGARKVTGSVSDTSYSPKERRLCHASVQFTAKHT
jgi:hypothetical protein